MRGLASDSLRRDRVDGSGGFNPKITISRLIDEERGQAFQPGHGMKIRFETARSTAAMRRFRSSALVTLAAMAALTALTAGATARQAHPGQPTEATAPREAGEPIMAIVSIKSQQVTFDFPRPALFAPNAQARAAARARAEKLGLEAEDAARVANEAKAAAAT